jgi:hypothetical protein
MVVVFEKNIPLLGPSPKATYISYKENSLFTCVVLLLNYPFKRSNYSYNVIILYRLIVSYTNKTDSYN